MSTSDPFLPRQGVRPEDDAPVQREDFDLEDESEPDVLTGAPDDESADEPPPVRGPFRAPTGQRVDPADDA